MDGREGPWKVEVDPVEDPFVVDGQGQVGQEVEEDPDAGCAPLAVLLHAGCMFFACASIESRLRE